MAHDIEAAAHAAADEETRAQRAWVWTMPRTRPEAAALGAASWWIVGVPIAVGIAAPGPWWVGVPIAVLGSPWWALAALMAVRARWTGAGPWWSLIACGPFLAWIIAAVVVARANTAWGVVGGIGLAALALTVTVLLWPWWTERTAARRRRWRWRWEDASAVA